MRRSGVERRVVTALRAAGFCCFLLAAGCAGLEREPPPAVAAHTVNEGAATVVAEPVALSDAPTNAVELLAQHATTPVLAAPTASTPQVVVEPIVQAATPVTTRPKDSSVVKPDMLSTKASVKPAATPLLAEPPPQKESPAPSVGQQQAVLDMAALEKRLRETKAIGVFTKITLKNQVDDLLNQFRAYYQGRIKTSLAELRQAYDRLLLKVLSLLQDGDRPLASEIVASRDAIWGILTDPVKFAKL